MTAADSDATADVDESADVSAPSDDFDAGGGDSEVQGAPPASVAASAAPGGDEPAQADVAVDSEPAPVPDQDADVVTEDDLTVFIAAVERALAGTILEGAVLDDPEIYIALAQSACVRFTDGQDFDAIATDLLASLASSDADTDAATLVGALLGAATRTICPEHADRL